MEFTHGETVFRDRSATTADPYNPSRQVRAEWDPELTIELEQAFVATSSSRAVATATRTQLFTDKSLYLTDPDADVQEGDRIRTGGTKEDLDSGTAYMVPARPIADTSPFTGWRPVVEIPLELPEG